MITNELFERKILLKFKFVLLFFVSITLLSLINTNILNPTIGLFCLIIIIGLFYNILNEYKKSYLLNLKSITNDIISNVIPEMNQILSDSLKKELDKSKENIDMNNSEKNKQDTMKQEKKHNKKVHKLRIELFKEQNKDLIVWQSSFLISQTIMILSVYFMFIQ